MKRRIVVVLATIVILLLSLFGGATSASASTHADHGCPAGAVCLYTNDPNGTKWLNSTPSYVFFSYGAHNISGAYGAGEWEDNQYGSTGVGSYLCSGYNGTGTVTTHGALSGPNSPPSYVAYYTYVDFTPVNSVKLVSAGWVGQYGQAC